MATQATPVAGSETLKVQRTIFNLDTMEEVTLVKSIEFNPVKDMQEFVARLGNDTAKILAVVNRGLRSEVQQSAVDNASIAWQAEDEDGKLSEFQGTPADQSGVNNLVLSLAKQVFGYSKDAPVETKRAAKEAAINMIRSNDQIREGLKKNAAATPSA